jgi:hypothetical protein
MAVLAQSADSLFNFVKNRDWEQVMAQTTSASIWIQKNDQPFTKTGSYCCPENLRRTLSIAS